jgi:hypothetical protein
MILMTLKPVEFSQKQYENEENSRRNCGWSEASTTTQKHENRNQNNRDEKCADRLEMSVRNKHDYDVLT